MHFVLQVLHLDLVSYYAFFMRAYYVIMHFNQMRVRKVF